MREISWGEFTVVELRVGTLIEVEDFPEACIPAYKVKADFGHKIGVRKASAQITMHYSKQELLGRQIVGVENFPPKQIGPMPSDFLLTGFYREDNSVVIAIPERAVPDGAKLG